MRKALAETLAGVRVAYSPVFSKDGTRLLHIADDSGEPQLWSLDLGSGARRQVTFEAEPVLFFARSPKDDTLVYGTDCGGDERQQLHLLPGDGGAPRNLTQRPETIHSWGGFARDGSRIAYTANERNGVDFDLYVRDLTTGEERCLLPREGMCSASGWNSRGEIALVEERSHFDQDLLLVDAATGATRALSRRHGTARYGAIRFRRNGGGLWCFSELGGEHMGLCLWPPGEDALHPVLFVEGADLDGLSVARGGRLMAATANRAGWSELLLFDPEDPARSLRRVEGIPAGVVYDLAFSPDGGRLVFSLGGPTMPRGLWILDLATMAARQVLAGDAGTLAGRLRPWHEVRVPSFDGLELPCFLALPEARRDGGAHPAVIWVHGGPEAQTRPVFRGDIQALLATGHAVLLPNVRGSTGYGRSYAALDDGRRRLDAVEDLRRVRLWLGAHPGIDDGAVAAMGQSYGGFMVLSTLARHPELWKAAVAHYGFASIIDELQHTGAWRRQRRIAEYGDPERDRDFLIEASPLTHAHRIRAPLMVSHGLRDPRVPPRESERIAATLRGHGRTVETVLVPDAGHGYLRRAHKARVWGAMLEFLERHL